MPLESLKEGNVNVKVADYLATQWTTDLNRTIGKTRILWLFSKLEMIVAIMTEAIIKVE